MKAMYVIRFLVLGLIFIALAGFVTMSLWNWLIPTLFNGPTIQFAQALGLMLLGRLLVGGWGKGHHGKDGWKARMKARCSGVSEEEKEAFKKRFCDKWE